MKEKISGSVCIIFIVLTIGGLSLPKFDYGEEILQDGYLFYDDSFYYAEVARNFHDTGMFSFDGTTRTNGFHFLWQILLVLLYGALNVLGLGHNFIHAIVVANVAVIAASGLLLHVLLRPVVGGFVSVAIAASSMLFYSTLLLNGMETSLTLLTCLVVVMYVRSALVPLPGNGSRSRINPLLLAVLLFLVFLARVDAVAFVFAFMLALCILFPGRELRNALACLLALIGVYAAWNHVRFGSAWPISGRVKAFWAQLVDRTAAENYHFVADHAGRDVMGTLDDLYRIPPWLGDVTLFVAVLLLSLLFVILWKSENFIRGGGASVLASVHRAYVPDKACYLVLGAAGFSLIAYLIAQLLYYAIFSSHIWDWYLGAGIVGLCVTMLTLLFMLFRRISGTGRANVINVGLASGLLAVSIYVDHTVTRTVLTRIQNGDTWGKAAQRVVEWIGENTETNERIGIWAAGQIGYYSDRSVVNLEGLVGDVELLEANRENTLIDYVDRENISYVAQWFPNDAVDESTGIPKENYGSPLLKLRTRLIYQDTGRFKLVETIPAGTRGLRRNSIYIYRVLTGENWRNRVGGRQPAIRSDFDVYLLDDTLVYAKEPCVPEDVDATFFLHVDPTDPDDLPGPRRRYGFDNLDFRFADRGALIGGVCAVEVPLPGYGVAAIRTGQYVIVEGGFHHPWEGEIRLGSGPGRR